MPQPGVAGEARFGGRRVLRRLCRFGNNLRPLQQRHTPCERWLCRQAGIRRANSAEGGLAPFKSIHKIWSSSHAMKTNMKTRVLSSYIPFRDMPFH
jgi:hypothetical protein